MGLITEPRPSLVQRLQDTSLDDIQQQLTRANQQLAQAQFDNQELQQAVS